MAPRVWNPIATAQEPGPRRAAPSWAGSAKRRRCYPAAFTLALAACAIPALSEQLIGYVPTKDAEVSGASDEMDGHAVLSGWAAVTAKDHTAAITLGRGGTVRVCQTSVLQLTESKAAPMTEQIAAPLLLSLDRGAVEIDMAATASDAIMTPDLRFAVRTPGPLDLRLRVARNGDTCVENRGPGAPTLAVTDPFGEALYELLPNQHVLFEHGSLREVVDHETTPCGCPDPAGMSIADALLAPGAGRAPAANAAAEAHPFPAAVSEGLAPTPPVPRAPPGEVHAQVSETLTYNAQPEQPEPAAAPAPVAQQPAAQPRRDVIHAVGRFLRRIFGGGS